MTRLPVLLPYHPFPVWNVLYGKLTIDSIFNPTIGICTVLFMIPSKLVARGPPEALPWARAHRAHWIRGLWLNGQALKVIRLVVRQRLPIRFFHVCNAGIVHVAEWQRKNTVRSAKILKLIWIISPIKYKLITNRSETLSVCPWRWRTVGVCEPN